MLECTSYVYSILCLYIKVTIGHFGHWLSICTFMSTKLFTMFVYYETDFEKRNRFSLINHTFIFVYFYLTRYRYNFMQILLILIKVKSGLE